MAGTVTGVGLDGSTNPNNTRRNSILNNHSVRNHSITGMSVPKISEYVEGAGNLEVKIDVDHPEENREGSKNVVSFEEEGRAPNIHQRGMDVHQEISNSAKVVNDELLNSVESPVTTEDKVLDWISQCNTIENKLNPSDSMLSLTMGRSAKDNQLSLAPNNQESSSAKLVYLRNFCVHLVGNFFLLISCMIYQNHHPKIPGLV